MAGNLENVHVLLTGGTGYIGSRILPALLAEGARVTVLVRAPSDAAALDRLGNIGTHPRLHARCGDACRGCFGLEPGEWTSFDVVVHAAARPKLGREDAGELRRVHAGPARELARLAAIGSVKRALVLSTAYVCSDANGHLPECVPSSVGGRNAYEITKTEAEAIVTSRASGFAEVIRPGIVVPGGNSADSVAGSPLGAFLRAMAGQPGSIVRVPGREQVRPGFTVLEDLVRFVLHRIGSIHRERVCWNAVSNGPSVGEMAGLLESLKVARKVELSTKPGRTIFDSWRPYLTEQRTWETSMARAEATVAGFPLRTVDAAHFGRLVSCWQRGCEERAA